MLHLHKLAAAALVACLAGCGIFDYPQGQGVSPPPPIELPRPPIDAATTAAPVALRPVMMQAFFWDVPKKTASFGWWKNLEQKAPELAAAGITAVWIPPPSKGHVGQDDVGYGIYDRYDLGEFDQKGSVGTRYGTLDELLAAISALHASGIKVYVDVVMNHLLGADAVEAVSLLGGGAATVHTRFDYPGRGKTYSAFAWNKDRFNGIQEGGGWKQWHAWDFEPSADGEVYDNLLGAEIRYSDPSVRAETVAWGRWLTAKLGVDGYRVDAIKHIYLPFINEWLDAVKGDRFVVSEVWNGDPKKLAAYVTATGGRTHLFDVALHYVFQRMSDGEGNFDMRELMRAGLVAERPELSVTFVDNHDTVNGGALFSPVTNLKMLAYAYILTHDGYPCVFYKDYYEGALGEEIKRLIAVRRAHAHGPGRAHEESDADVYIYSRAGDKDHTGLLLLLNDGAAAAERTVVSPFGKATLVDASGHSSAEVETDAAGLGKFPVPARGYSLWVPKGT